MVKSCKCLLIITCLHAYWNIPIVSMNNWVTSWSCYQQRNFGVAELILAKNKMHLLRSDVFGYKWGAELIHTTSYA